MILLEWSTIELGRRGGVSLWNQVTPGSPRLPIRYVASVRSNQSSTHTGGFLRPNERARADHDELLPDQVLTLAETDPEVIDYFGDSAFGAVVGHGDLDQRPRLLVQRAGLIGGQALSEYTIMAGALRVGLSPTEIRETVYQAVPYLGMGKIHDFLHATNTLFTEQGIDLPMPPQSTTTPDDRHEKGLAVQKQTFGAQQVDLMDEG